MAEQPLVGLIMGSRSDWETMQHAAETLTALGVPFEQRVVSAHRTPDLLFEYAGSAESRGLQVLIAGAGGAAHLPGMAAAKTALPVLGVPVESKSLNGDGSLLSMVQMPAGVPVGTLAIGRAGRRQCRSARCRDSRALGRRHPRAAGRVPRRADAVRARRARPGRVRNTAGDARRLHRRRAAGADAGPRRAPARALVQVPRPVAGGSGREVGELVVGAYDDPAALARLADGAAVVTYEFENIPVAAARGVAALPPPLALELGQDRLVEKQLFQRLGIPTARFGSLAEMGLPALVKSRRLGYDGKGQRRLVAHEELGEDELAEEIVAFDRELSIVAVRGRDGETRFWPLAENVHRDGILRVSRAPAASPPQEEAEALVSRLLDELGYVGVIALELFEAERQSARERVRTTRAQLRPLDDRRRRHEPVRESPTGDSGPPARRRRTRSRPP